MIRTPLSLPFPQSEHRLRSPDPRRRPHRTLPAYHLNFQRHPLLSHPPSRQAEPCPILSTLPPARRRHRPRQASQNQPPTTIPTAFLRPLPNLANPGLVPLRDHARCLRHAIPRMAARTRSDASRHTPPVPSAASSRARRHQGALPAAKGRTMGVRSPPL
jgi:hypothetical protein